MKKSEVDTNQFRALLFEKKKTLLAAAADVDDSTQTVELDQTRLGRLSRIDALQTQAMAQETLRRDQLELNRIEAALERIQSDDYGYCLSCGEMIAEPRLRVDPAATLCITCAAAAEQELG